MNGNVEDRLKELQEICRQKGIPLTNQRRTVLEVLLQRNDHPTADQVFETVKDLSPQISRRTVYRVLDTLIELELIRRVHHSGAAARFDAKPWRHHHLVCLRCDKIVDLENTDLDGIGLPKGRPHGFELRDLSVQLLGICPECRKILEDVTLPGRRHGFGYLPNGIVKLMMELRETGEGNLLTLDAVWHKVSF